MGFDALVFDLDGTLWDTTAACAIAWNDVLAAYGIPYRSITADDVRRVTGRSHDDCIRLTFPDLPEAQLRELIDATAVADVQAIDRLGGTIYPDVFGGLRRLRDRYRLFIVSNCQSGYIETFFRFAGVGELFDDSECFGNTGLTKAGNLASLIARNGLLCPLMIGDTEGDASAAHVCAVPFAHVSYGFGEVERADFRFPSFGALVSSLIE